MYYLKYSNSFGGYVFFIMFAMKKISVNISQIFGQLIFTSVKVQFFINKYLVNMLKY